MNLSLTIGTLTRPIEDWAASAASLSFQSFAPDVFSITLDEASPGYVAALGDVVELFEDRRRVFKGTLSACPSEFCAGADTYHYTALGLWDALERLPYRCPWIEKRSQYANGFWNIYHEEACQLFGLRIDRMSDYTSVYAVRQLYARHSVAFTLDVALRVAAGALASDARYHFGAQRLTSYSDAVLDQGSSDLYAMPYTTLPKETLGASDLWIVPPYEEKILANVGDVLSACQKWMPDLLSWYDYGEHPPRLRITPSRALEEEALELEEIAALKLNTRQELKPRGLVLLKLLETERSTGSYWGPFKRSTEYAPPGTAPARVHPDTMLLPYDVPRGEDDPGDLTALAASIWQAVNLESLEGSVSFYSDELSTRYVAKKLNVRAPNLAPQTAIVQSDTIDLMTGLRTLTFSAHKKRSCLDMIAQYKYLFKQAGQAGLQG